MACKKRPFDSPEQARKQLRVWQRKARRSALDTVHVYKCTDEDHRGQFHVGHSPATIKRTQSARDSKKRQAYEETRSQILGSLDDLFHDQVVRIKGVLLARQARDTRTDGPLIHPLTTLAPHGDDLDVQNK